MPVSRADRISALHTSEFGVSSFLKKYYGIVQRGCHIRGHRSGLAECTVDEEYPNFQVQSRKQSKSNPGIAAGSPTV